MTSSVETADTANVCAPAFEPVLDGGRRTVTPRLRAISPVPSPEQSSTTMTSAGASVWRWSDSIVSAIDAASLYAGTITVTAPRAQPHASTAPESVAGPSHSQNASLQP